MRTRSKLLLTTFAAAAILAAAISTASANSFGANKEDIRAVFDELTFVGPFGQNIICEVTLEGSFHETTISKEAELFGHITRAIVNEDDCDGAADFATVLDESLPWNISNEGWEGTLPNIEAIFLLLNRPAFEIVGSILGDCLYEGNANGIAVPGGSGTTLVADSSTSIPLVSGDIFCPGSGRFAGEAAVTLLGTDDPVIITLV